MRWFRVIRLLALVVVLLLVCDTAIATTYAQPRDFGVACLELGTGAIVWKRRGHLRSPKLAVGHGLVFVEEDPDAIDPDEVPQRRTLSAHDGLRRWAKRKPGARQELIGLPEVAVDPRRLSAELRALDFVLGLPESVHTDLAVDGGRLVASIDQHIVAIAHDTGAVLWRTELPRQRIRVYDSPWTRFARVGDVLVIQVYERLFALRADDGALLWSFDAGPHSTPWPVVVDDRVYVQWREGAVDVKSSTF